MPQLSLTNSVVSSVTQDKGWDVAGDPPHTHNEEEDSEHDPRGWEDLEQDGNGHEHHGPKQDGFSSKPAGIKRWEPCKEEPLHLSGGLYLVVLHSDEEAGLKSTGHWCGLMRVRATVCFLTNYLGEEHAHSAVTLTFMAMRLLRWANSEESSQPIWALNILNKQMLFYCCCDDTFLSNFIPSILSGGIFSYYGLMMQLLAGG